MKSRRFANYANFKARKLKQMSMIWRLLVHFKAGVNNDVSESTGTENMDYRNDAQVEGFMFKEYDCY